MAKKRKSIFDTDTSPQAINDVAKTAQEKTIDPIPSKESIAPKSQDSKSPLTMVRLSRAHRQKAKSNAARRNMLLTEYMEWLITQDTDKI